VRQRIERPGGDADAHAAQGVLPGELVRGGEFSRSTPMGEPGEKKPQQSRAVVVCTIVFVVAGIAIFQAVAPRFFPPPPEGGLDMQRTLWAGIVGAVCGGVGAGVGKLIDVMRK
jgi:hypothetical protein